MANIFDPTANKDLLTRLEKLNDGTTALWGKMNVSQMLWHCQKPLDVVEGRLFFKRNLMGILFGKIAKNSFLKNKGFSKNSPTAPQFKTDANPDFQTEKNGLIAMVERFGKLGPAVIATSKHPFFGEMTDDEWGELQYIHIDHHLKQFGI